MEYRINEFAKLSGVSVRTLHYYDEIGLLRPSRVDKYSGYRYYDDMSVSRMQEILFFRELDFSLKDIQEILTSKNYDKQKALQQQKELLLQKRKRLERLIEALESAEKGERNMSFDAFDNSEYEKKKKEYEKEVKEKYGKTDAYKENEKKWSGFSNEKQKSMIDGLNDRMQEFAELKATGENAEGEKAQKMVEKLQSYISENFYTCTKEILAGLGLTYVEDERFRENIDKNGEGTARFIADAISKFCK